MAEVAEYPVSFSQMTLVDWLDDLTVRFLLNLPPAELSSVPRLCFQVEEAQWFYEDFIRPANPHLPSLNLRQFCMTLFQHCPLLSGFDAAQHLAAYEEFLAYKVRVPVRGAILMDETMEKVLLVRGWKKGASWSFPRGKINKNEKDLDCAIREVYEETGFDLGAAGLVQLNEENGQVKAIDITMREQHMKLFVFRGVPLDTYFEPKTRKEISKIQWYNVKDLPGYKKLKGSAGHGQGEAHASKFYMVAPFLGQLKKWIVQQRRSDAMGLQAQHDRTVSASNVFGAGITEDEGETEPDVPHDRDANIPSMSAEDLRRLLSIGQVPVDAAASAQPNQSQEPMKTHTSNLLAMLHGGQPSTYQQESAEQKLTPFQHAAAISLSSDVRLASPPFQHQHPTFNQTPSSPTYQQSQREQRFQPVFQGSAAGLPASMYDPTRFPQMQTFQDRQQGTHHLASHSPALVPGQNRSGQVPFDPFHPTAPPMSQLHSLASQHHANPHIPFDPMQRQGPPSSLVSGPKVPEASKLPAPRLNPHSMKLLDAFKATKSSNAASASADSSSANQPKAGSLQQAALLDLFKKAPTKEQTPPPASNEVPGAKMASPISVEKVPGQMERKITANEITRTMPLKTTPRLPSYHEPTVVAQPKQEVLARSRPQENTPALISHTPETQQSSHHVTSSKQQVIPTRPQNVAKGNHTFLQARQAERGSPIPTVSVLQRPSSRQADGPSRSADKNVAQSPPTSQFSILQRPGSSAGKVSRQAVPQSPLRNDSNVIGFQPQVLKRPTTGAENEKTVDTGTKTEPPTTSAKTDHLLALFGKTSARAPSPRQDNPIVSENDTSANPQQRDMLLNLLSSGSSQRPAAPTTSTPPPAPQLVPERNPSRSQNSTRNPNQQHLLNLMSVQTSTSAGSPGTPISPFTLGTPISKYLPGVQQVSDNSGESRSRLGSVASMISNSTNSGRQTPTPSSVTPTEAKGVLLDYLNGVVKEGYRGGKRSGL